MASPPPSDPTLPPRGSPERPFSAFKWEREVAAEFQLWRKTSDAGFNRMASFAEAVERSVRGNELPPVTGKIALMLHEALVACDTLAFGTLIEVSAYAGLHLLDRYGRVNQVLDYLMTIGRLPLRRTGVRALEVGAGPAPALYATRDYYADILAWPALGDLKLGPLKAFHTIDRGSAWNWLLHHLSEQLIAIRGIAPEDGQLAFGTAHDDFKGFDVQARHQNSILRAAGQIVREFDEADEPISHAAAMQLAHEQGVAAPSAYDLVFMCNFLTQPEMTEHFELELRRLTRSLTPGGLVIVLGATRDPYPEVYSRVRAIANESQLHDVSPAEPFRANPDPRHLSLIADHVRQNVDSARLNCPPDVWAKVASMLPVDLVDAAVRFTLPRFQALAFVRQGPSSREQRKRRRRGPKPQQ